MNDYISSDFLETQRYLAHASMAGMPTNVARRLGYKKVTGDVNTGVGAKEKAKARVDAAEKKVNELRAKVEEYSNSLYNAVLEVKSLNPVKRVEGFIGLVNGLTSRKEFINLKNEYVKAMDEYYDATSRYAKIEQQISTYRANKDFEEHKKRTINDYNKFVAEVDADFNKKSQEIKEEHAKNVASNKAKADDWFEKESARMEREYINQVNAMRNTAKGSKAGMPSNIRKRK